MDGQSPSSRVVGRLAGVLLVACGALSAATLPLPQPAGTDRDAVLLVSVTAIAFGFLALVVPWSDAHPRASLVLLPIAFGLISAGNYLGNAQPYTYSVFFIVAFVWVGLGHPRCTSLPFLIPASVAYAVPILLRPDAGPAVASLFLVMPVCAFVAETIAWIGARERLSRDRSMALARVALSLGPHLNVEGLSQTLACEVRAMLHADRGAFFLVDDGVIADVFSAGFPDDARNELRALAGRQLQHAPGLHDLCAGRPVMTEDTRTSSPLIEDAARYDVRSYIAVPVIVEDELRGILVSTDHGRPRKYRPDDVRTAQALAAQAGAALRNALLYERTLAAAHGDHLTGLGNRRAFYEQLEAELERTRRGNESLSLLILDVDRLKEINDAFGHAAGDEVLERLARLVRDGSGNIDGVYRIGGDEFAALLPEAGRDRAFVVAERIRLAVQEGRIMNGAGPITVSVGVSTFPDHGANGDELFERADTAMYEAKRAGRNAVCAASEPRLGRRASAVPARR